MDRPLQLLDRGNLSPSHQSRLLRALARLCKLYACFPDSLILSGVQRTRMDPSAGGGFADIWRGQLSTRCIAIKALRIFEQSDREKALKDFSHEAIIWRQLKHPNILPFYGVFKGDENFERLCLISPWMDAGNINDYLKKYPESNRLALIADALNGLSYLHSFQPSIIHGDLKGANIFVTHSRTACLGDFGLSRFRDSHESTLGATSGHSTGTLRWQAPELFVNVDGRTARPSAESDVYSIGCVCLELMTGKPPFSEFSRDGAVLTAVLNKKCPQRPSEDLVHRGLNDSLWSLMKKCWHFDRDQRPKVGTLLQFFVERKWSTGPHLLRRGDLSANVSLNMTSSPVEILDVGMTGNVAGMRLVSVRMCAGVDRGVVNFSDFTAVSSPGT
ncbi:kinase-like protein [Rickenella mellea]|uniref:Kinase-like protein n=1 Tax=Rickenella mellea TaxID=50990 RepID=A0A4Y7PYN8_9AGAM|nr:kinase-like protein [Rickenella mellea]